MRTNGRRACWHGRRWDAAALGLCALFFICFFPQVFFGHRFIIAGDAYYYSYPLRTVAWRMLRQGTVPLWTPHVLAGYPLLSMAQLGLAYPLTWGYLFLPGHVAEQLYVLAPFLLSPLFTYAYARETGRTRLAALLAGLAFGYGGMMCGFIANSGLLTNTLMWMPLVLLYVERARTRPFAYCLARAGGVYALAVLAGHAQSYVSVGLVAAAYGLFLSLADAGVRRGRARWRPLLVALCALLCAAGVAAFQLLETLRAARHSIRSALSYEAFSEGSFAPREALLSVGAPLYHYVDTSAYLAPLALALALAAVAGALGRRMRDPRIFFWLAVALAAFALMLGAHTPLYRFVYRLPILNQFRVPSRHTFEWTFALSILAAYGWDAVADHFARRQPPPPRGARAAGPLACALLLTGSVVAALWWRATAQPPVPNPTIYTGLAEAHYWLWKLAFTCVIGALAGCCFRVTARRARTLLLAATILLACYAEPAAVVSCWWGHLLSLPASRFQLVAPTTRYLEQFAPTEGRIYTRATLFAEEFNVRPRLDAPNLPTLRGLNDVAGMEPLILERYSRALGGVGPDAVTPRAGFPPNDDLFAARSHVLDILNTTHVVSFAGLRPFEAPFVYRDGVGLSAVDLTLSLAPGATARLAGGDADADQIALVTSLANSTELPNGEPVARLRIYTTDGATREQTLRAGYDTAEWAHERADVRALVAHKLAPVFDTRAGDTADTFPALRYWTRLALDAPARIKQIEITNTTRAAQLALWRASLYDARSAHSTPLAVDTRSEFWTNVYDADGVQIQHNARALPRAWLVNEAEAVDGEEALHRIRGESEHEFDPHRTALLEVNANELPALAGGAMPNGTARVTVYEPSRLLIETDAATASVLVVSEINYPGWVATVDGHPARIMPTDYLLRGVALPAGHHQVEMRYRAPLARTGALISALTLCLLAGLAVYACGAKKR